MLSLSPQMVTQKFHLTTSPVRTPPSGLSRSDFVPWPTSTSTYLPHIVSYPGCRVKLPQCSVDWPLLGEEDA